MKPAVLGVIAFAVGLAASTGAVYARRGSAAPDVVADSAHAESPDSTQQGHGAAKSDSSGHPAAKPDSLKHGGPDSAKAETHEPAPVAHATVAPSTPTEHPATAVDSTASAVHAPASVKTPQPDYPRLAKILSAMPVANATELVGRLNDRDAEGIIRALGQRQAAAFLAALPKDRAAALSQRLLIPRDSVGGR